MAKIYDPFMAATEDACLSDWRDELLVEARGRVLEIGAGTGINLSHYPRTGIDDLILTEPDTHMRQGLEARHRQEGVDAQVVVAGADALPFADASFDTVVSTLVLCSVPDPDAAVAEIYRVLKPDGRLIYIEHVAADDNPSRLKWQRRVEPLWKHLADGCHLCRRTDETLERAGFNLEGMVRESMRKALPIVRPTIRGVARK